MTDTANARALLEGVETRLQGVIYILDAIAKERGEESNALSLMARELDSIYADVDELAGLVEGMEA